MAPDDDPKAKDPTVKDLLAGAPLEDVVDDATRRELERWFGMPSAEALEAEGKQPGPSTDPEILEVQKQREAALAAIDPALVAMLDGRAARCGSDAMLQFRPSLDVHIDPKVALFDLRMLERVSTVADPRDFERPQDIEDELKSCAPQALLRDLHRPDTYFENKRELVDMAAELRLDIVEEVKAAMATSWKLPPLGRLPFVECRELLDAGRAQRRQSWPILVKQLKLTNRRVEE